MNAEFLQEIEEPQNLQLQQLLADSRTAVEAELAEHNIDGLNDDTLTRFSYTYYHDWETDDPDYVFLLEDPGMPGEHVIMEAAALARRAGQPPSRELVSVFRRFGARWLARRRYADFTGAFVTICADAGLIDPDEPWWQYLLDGGFFDDFYMGDVVKYRAPNVGTADLQAAFTEQLLHELEYVDPDLIFAFGKRAWEACRDRLGVTIETAGVDPDRMHSVHGRPGEATRLLDTTVLPLGHMSPNFLGAQIPHEEYFERLEDGLRELSV